MATLEALKRALRETAEATTSPMLPLSDEQYKSGFDILREGRQKTYQDFIIPQLTSLVESLLKTRNRLRVLEIGPGPVSILQYLPLDMRERIREYRAFEPNHLFSSCLQHTFSTVYNAELPFPHLDDAPYICRGPFSSEDANAPDSTVINCGTGYDMILLCHSLYGLKPESTMMQRAIEKLTISEDAMVVVFHHQGVLNFDRLVCHKSAIFPTGTVRVRDSNEGLDSFASFILGSAMKDHDVRTGCRNLGRREEAHPNHIFFGAPNIMMAFTKHATKLPELVANVPLVEGSRIIKNSEARLHHTGAIFKPTNINHIQQCVQWARKHRCPLTVLGGSHSGYCLWPSTLGLDMGSFNKVHIHPGSGAGNSSPEYYIVAEAACTTGDIIRKAMEMGLTVPLGARPSVGAGLWLQGGIGHLSRLYGLSCDAIVGAVIVNMSGQIQYLGHIPGKQRPIGVPPFKKDEEDLLWEIRGAGTNFGIMVSVTFRAYKLRNYVARTWIFPLENNQEARQRLSNFDKHVAQKIPRNCSADAYLYSDADQLRLGVTIFESSEGAVTSATVTPHHVATHWGPDHECKIVDSIGLFDTDMYIKQHGGHGGGNTCSFKRCVFLKCIGDREVAGNIIWALKIRPSQQCYLHLVQGGGAVCDTAPSAIAFGCRDWDFACVITGVWPRDQDDTEVSHSAKKWVYSVVGALLSINQCRGVYGADLGPDPRDGALAVEAFGSNLERLVGPKRSLDPQNLLAYACPLSGDAVAKPQQLILLVTGESCAGKDYCAIVWARFFINQGFTARTASISDDCKRRYSEATGADLVRLLEDRDYKESHRPALTKFFEDEVRCQPKLPEMNFERIVRDYSDVDVLLITGMRDNAPVAAFSSAACDSRVLEIYVEASPEIRRGRRGANVVRKGNSNGDNVNEKILSHRPSLVFNNNLSGMGYIESFAERYLTPILLKDLRQLAGMVGSTPDFPQKGIEFRDVFGIPRVPGGLELCTSLLQKHFTGDWSEVRAIVCCEAGGFVFASALALRMHLPLILIRKAGKLPPDTLSTSKATSYISSISGTREKKEKILEIQTGIVPLNSPVVVVDDLLATGETLCGVLQLLKDSGVHVGNISVMTVAELPAHGGRFLLHQRGYGRVNIQSLLVFSGK